MGDIVFEPGQFTSKWLRADEIGGEFGKYGQSNSQRFVVERVDSFNPVRFEVSLYTRAHVLVTE